MKSDSVLDVRTNLGCFRRGRPRRFALLETRSVSATEDFQVATFLLLQECVNRRFQMRTSGICHRRDGKHRKNLLKDDERVVHVHVLARLYAFHDTLAMAISSIRVDIARMGDAHLQNLAMPFPTNSAEGVPLDGVISSDRGFIAEAEHEAG